MKQSVSEAITGGVLGVTVLSTATLGGSSVEAPRQPTAPSEVSADATCVPPKSESDLAKLREAAVRCARLRQAGRIAMVGFGVPQDSLNTLADLTEAVLNISSDGLVAIRVDAVAYKPKETGSGRQPTGCVSTPISKMARATMPSLTRYPAVVAITPLPKCKDDVLGRSYGKSDADVYEVPLQLNTDGVALSVAHELYHSLFAMGHRGEVSLPPEQRRIWTMAMDMRRGTFDLGMYLAYCQMQGYSNIQQKDVMGYTPGHGIYDTGVPFSELTISAPHKNYISWADRILKPQTPSRERQVGDRWVSISAADSLRGVYASVRLNAPVVVKAKVDGKYEEHRFSHIAFMPPVAEHGQTGPDFYIGHFTQPYLVSEDGATVVSTAQLPIHYESVQDGRATLRNFALLIGNQRIELADDAHRFSMRVTRR